MKEISDYLNEMHIESFLEELDDFGDAHVYIHEAAKRIRFYRNALMGELAKATIQQSDGK